MPTIRPIPSGRQHIGRMIVVGADNEYIPKLLGWETARTMDEALRMAKQTAPAEPDILALHSPPILMAEMHKEKPRTSVHHAALHKGA